MSTEALNLPAADRGVFLRARVASFVGIAPLGVWTLMHLWSQLSAFQGAEAWERDVTAHAHPLAHWLTSFIVLAPLFLHAAWGISRLRDTRVNAKRYGFLANFKYLAQRASAVGLLLFLCAHIWLAMLHPRLVEGHPETFADIAAHMHHHPPTIIVYLLGTLGMAYHLANGLSTFAMGWGLVSSKKGVLRANLLGYVLFFAMLAIGWGSLYALYTGGAAFPVPVD